MKIPQLNPRTLIHRIRNQATPDHPVFPFGFAARRALAGTSPLGSRPFVEKTGAHGIMLEATRFLAKGTVVIDFSDAVESSQAYQTVQAGMNRHLLEPTLAKLNHSCAPTLIIDTTTREALAARNIYPGDELNFFYPSTEWTMAEPFSCACGSSRCIGRVRGAAYLTTEELRGYWLNTHIKRRLGGRTLPAAASADLPSLRPRMPITVVPIWR